MTGPVTFGGAGTSLRIATVNINGIRATLRRGFGDWLRERGCDVIALQEVRAQADKLPGGAFGEYHAALDTGSVPGRNGVAVLTRQPPAAVRTWSGTALLAGPSTSGERPSASNGAPPLAEVPAEDRVVLPRGLRPFADQGRYIEVDLAEAPVTIASLYLPKGGLPAELQRPERMREAPDGGARYARKMAFMAAFSTYLTRARRAAAAAGREYLLMGDMNIAHTCRDLAAWRRNQQNDGFLPEEREWFGQQLGPRTLVDVVRSLRPEEDGPYSWWSWLGQSFAKDAGWRIDYHLATPRLARSARRAVVDRDVAGTRLSDHAPVVVEYGG
ncbi:endonuclease/exonuclease/phosphatase family protein [Brachybacterium halotolerans subsp. kimchii]|uniref:exodeoxyribonuclease III n=1 Tax=Brachybacterium halotolerans TaxID=2795215 RepID=UPI001E59AB99|nr:exodeoxyribonuclease III [Brachybacterium halotolerans]UEJ81312.1 endonuclease/exonuclease/phosphatase family protein [Brachybacterium halotolerans subsp. kimchii]